MEVTTNKQSVRERLIQVVEEQGIKVNFIAKKLGWDYPHMIRFKNEQANYSPDRLQTLSEFLSKYE